MPASETPPARQPPTSPEPISVGPITRTDIVKFAGAGGDFNPVHHDEEFAHRAGYPSVFAMGMFTAGLLGDYVASWLGIENIERFAVRFLSPVWPGDQLDFTAEQTIGEGRVIAGRLSASAGGEARVSGEVHGGQSNRPAGEVPDTADDLRYLLDTPPAEVSLPIERGKVMEFARAIHSSNPLHLDRAAAAAAGFADVIAPLTFSAASAHYNGGDAADVPKALGFDISRVLHGEERWTYHRPAVAGEVLTGVRTVAAAWRKPTRSGGAMTFVLLPTEYHDAEGQLIIRDEQLMIEMPARSSAGAS